MIPSATGAPVLTFRLRLRFTPSACREAAGVLRSLSGPVRSEPGCLDTRLMRDLDDPLILAWIEEWRNLEAFERHLRTPRFRTVLAVMEMADDAPIVEIDAIQSRRGFDRIEELLAKGHAGESADDRTGATT